MLNTIGHFALGFLAGVFVRRIPAFSVCLTLIMGRYQRLEQNILRDAGYHEMWQYGAGFVVGAFAGWGIRWLREKRRKRRESAINAWLGL